MRLQHQRARAVLQERQGLQEVKSLTATDEELPATGEEGKRKRLGLEASPSLVQTETSATTKRGSTRHASHKRKRPQEKEKEATRERGNTRKTACGLFLGVLWLSRPPSPRLDASTCVNLCVVSLALNLCLVCLAWRASPGWSGVAGCGPPRAYLASTRVLSASLLHVCLVCLA